MAVQHGETESALLLLHVDGGKLDNVTVQVGNLRSASGSTMAGPRPRQLCFVHIPRSERYESRDGWFADPLLPMPDGGMAIDDGQAQGIWLELPVDSGTDAGLYQGEVQVRGTFTGNATGSETFVLSAPVKVFVSELEVPSPAESKIGSAWSGDWRGQYFRDRVGGERYNQTAYFDMMQQYRTPPDAIYGSAIRPMEELAFLSEAGDHDFNILQVDLWLQKHAEAYCSGGDGDNHLLIQTAEALNSTIGIVRTCPQAVEALIEELRPTVEELDARGALGSAYVYGYDEVPRSSEAEIRAVFGALKREFPKLRTHVAINWELPPDMPVDIWTVAYQQSNSGEIDVTPWLNADPARRVWWYHCIEPHQSKFLNTFIDRTPVQGRLLMWLGAQSEASKGYPNGWLYYKMDSYLNVQDESVSRQTLKRRAGREASRAFLDYDPRHYVWFLESRVTAPEHLWWEANTYVYPGDDGGPIPSVRLAALRDGLEDWELFQKLPADVVTSTVSQLVQSATSWRDDHARLEELRARLLGAPWARS